MHRRDQPAPRRQGPLVGRQRELAAVEDALERLARGRSGWLVLSGDPGVGKTGLLTQLASGAAQRGHVVLAGRGAELERELPFGVWVDAVDDHVGSIGEQRIARLVGDRADELARVLPSVRAARRPHAPVLQDER